LEGVITPSGLHFERSHSGVPDIDPTKHRLLIHGMVKRPLIFTVDALLRYPMVSRVHFIECAGKSLMFTYPMQVKSLITRPSHGMTLPGPGAYQISGIAWSGEGTIRRVEITTDGGRSWDKTALDAPVLPRALTRFRLPWRWDGGATVLKSRAVDDRGNVQPEREKFIAEHGNNAIFHCNAIQAWSVAASGEVKHVYA